MVPKVSIVVTTYNRRELLKETVLSILSQTFSDFELIIVDNNSNYNFEELISSFNDERIRAFQHGNDGIIAVNRNYGIKLAVAEYIALCDDDDVWETNKLEEQIRIMDRHPSVGLSCTGVSYINLVHRKTAVGNFSAFLKTQILSFNIVPAKYLLIFLPYITNSSVLFKKSIVALVGDINEDPEIRTIEDYEYWFRAALKIKIHYTSKKLVRYRLHEQQLSLADHNVSDRTLNVVKNYWSELNFIQRLIFKLKVSLNS